MKDQALMANRREFLRRAAGLAWAGLRAPQLYARAKAALPNPVGYATISWPREEFPHALETISHLGFEGVQILGWVQEAYAGPQGHPLKERLQALRLQPVALSCRGMHLDPARLRPSEDRLITYATWLKELGGLFLQVTDKGKPGQTYTPAEVKALGERMNELGKLAQDYGLSLGYHPHVGTMGETREGLGRVLEATDPRYVKLIADVAHLTLGGSDPAEVIRTYRNRLLFAHFKDVRKDVAALARKDLNLARRQKYYFCEIGTGVVNFPAILAAFRGVNFTGWVVVELDHYEIPEGGPDAAARANRKAGDGLGFQLE